MAAKLPAFLDGTVGYTQLAKNPRRYSSITAHIHALAFCVAIFVAVSYNGSTMSHFRREMVTDSIVWCGRLSPGGEPMRMNRYVPITESMVEHLEQFRKKRKMTQAQYAKMIGLSLSGYKGILHGRTNRMSWEHYQQLMDSEPKIYWFAHLDGEQFIQIADVFDQYDYDFEMKKRFYFGIRDCVLDLDASSPLISSLVKKLHFYSNFISSESFRLFCDLNICPDPGAYIIDRNNDAPRCTNEDYIRDYSIFLERMERFRTEQGISQAEFAKQLGYSLAKYKRIITMHGPVMAVLGPFHAEKLLEKVSLVTAAFGSRLDPIALALDETPNSYEFKKRVMLMFDLMEEELGLTDQYIQEVAERVRIWDRLHSSHEFSFPGG